MVTDLISKLIKKFTENGSLKDLSWPVLQKDEDIKLNLLLGCEEQMALNRNVVQFSIVKIFKTQNVTPIKHKL